MSTEVGWGKRQNIRWAILSRTNLDRFNSQELLAVALHMQRSNRRFPAVLALCVIGLVAWGVVDGYWPPVILALPGIALSVWQWERSREAVADELQILGGDGPTSSHSSVNRAAGAINERPDLDDERSTGPT